MANTLKKVSAIGYKAVQASGLGPIPESELVSILNGEGLQLCATHEPGTTIINEPDKVVERLQKLACVYTAYPYPVEVDLNDAVQVRRLAKQLERSGEVLQQAGMVLTYHNHAIELLRLGDGTVLDAIYEQTDAKLLQAEIDTYWIQYGGGDPVDWCLKLSRRLPLLHMKDYQMTPKNEPTYAKLDMEI